jgi:dihydroxyacetone kinase-like protein
MVDERIAGVRFIRLLERTCEDMEAAQEELRELDARAGDGDLGVTVALGCRAVRELLPRLSGEDIGEVLLKSGAAFNAAGASTFGTLMATVLLRAGGAAKGRTSVDVKDLAAMAASAVDGVRERGKASAGERTMLDAMLPARDRLSRGSETGETLAGALEAAARAAEEGAQSTGQMTARHGRAGWLGDRARGVPDAGAVAVAMMLRAFAGHALRGSVA